MNTEKIKKPIRRIKHHLEDHKVTYLTGAGCLATGYFLRPQVVNIVDVCNFKYKSPTETTIINILERRACMDPIPVRDKLTGEIYASINRAATVTGATVRSISNDAQGAAERFERLSDEVLA